MDRGFKRVRIRASWDGERRGILLIPVAILSLCSPVFWAFHFFFSFPLNLRDWSSGFWDGTLAGTTDAPL